MFQLFSDNYRLELTPVNNLFLYFNRYFQDSPSNQKVLRIERKIVKIVFVILNSSHIQHLDEDFYVVSKLIQFSFYVLDIFEFDKYQSLYLKYLALGIGSESTNAYMENFYDFYLAVNFRFKAVDPLIHEAMEKRLENGILEAAFDKALAVLETHKDFSAIGYNDFIRNALIVHFILSNYPKQISQKQFKHLLLSLNTLYKEKYDQIHKISKLEKLFVDIFQLILKLTRAVSLKTSALFLDIFTQKSEFLIGSVFDKFVYMGMYNSFFKRPVLKLKWTLDKETVKVNRLPTAQTYEDMEPYRTHIIQQDSINMVVYQLGLQYISPEKELILFQFLENIYMIDKPKVRQMSISSSALRNTFEKVFK